jgi:hypothetical protein
MNADLLNIDFTTLGFYEPGFIHLEVSTRENLNDFNALASNPETAHLVSTFFHEYIHFLQDISTTHGLLNFIHAVEYLKNANKQVTEAGVAHFETPLKITNNSNWLTNNRLMHIYRGGENEGKRVSYLGYKANKEEVETSKGEKIIVPKYLVKCYDHSAQTITTCHFGSKHLKEYMAHAVQNQYAPNTIHDDIPYRLVELIVEKEFPRLARNPSLLVALCDASLMDQHPARLFFRTLERMKERPKRSFKEVEAVYSFAFKNFSFANEGKKEKVDSVYKDTANRAIGQIQDSLKADIFRPNVQWFEEVLKEAMQLRIEHPIFFTQLVQGSKKFSPLFYKVVSRLGIPFMTNSDQKGFFLPPEKLKSLNINPYYPKVFQAICETFRGEKKCVLHAFCETRTDKKVTDDNCLNSPWERVNQPELCPYAQMWKTWGLAGLKPSV